MTKTVDYYFTLTSPWSFLGHAPFLELCRETGAEIRFKPVDFGAVFAVSGGLPLPKRAPQRQRYRLFDLERWRRERGVPLKLHPAHFPTDPAPGARLVIAADEAGLDVGRLVGAIMHACWCEDRDVADRVTLEAIATDCGGEAASLMARSEAPEIAARAAALTEEAKAEQVFGAPTYVYRGEPFWGQDRLDLLAKAMGDQVPPVTVTFP